YPERTQSVISGPFRQSSYIEYMWLFFKEFPLARSQIEADTSLNVFNFSQRRLLRVLCVKPT
ncbi:MAG: hypothetical protein KKG06_07145, partial [Bacteroidetes bacterium]|nr:hypothetical protein [Bacteroidota bacterium]